MNDPVIALHHLSKNYGNVHATQMIDIHAHRCEYLQPATFIQHVLQTQKQ